MAVEEDAEVIQRRFEDGLGLGLTPLRELVDLLFDCFSADAGGLPGLGDLPVRERAVISDQVLMAAQGALTNLVEARIQEGDLQATLADGSRYSSRNVDEVEQEMRQALLVIGLFRAVGSALDCMAAVAIATARLPLSVRRASVTQILGVRPTTAASTELRNVWTELRDLVDRESNTPPDWLRWTLEMRNALMHRGRQLSLSVQRPIDLPDIALPRTAMREVFEDRVRFDRHFRKRPWLPDIEHLADDQVDLTTAMLSEPEARTARGIVDATDRFLAAVAGWAAPLWRRPPPGLSSPTNLWRSEAPQSIAFDGFAPEPFKVDIGGGLVSPRDFERLALAQRLRKGDHEDPENPRAS
jgi:hypothetical protein